MYIWCGFVAWLNGHLTRLESRVILPLKLSSRGDTHMNAKKQNAWSVSEAKGKFSEVLKLSHNEPQRIFSDGKPAGAVISDDDYALLMSIKQEQTKKLIEDLILAGKNEDVSEETFDNLKSNIKKITVE